MVDQTLGGFAIGQHRAMFASVAKVDMHGVGWAEMTMTR